MASSGKFDLSSSSPSRPLYTSAKRGSYSIASMDRSTSFRENMDNPMVSSIPSMSRSSSINVSQGDVTNFFQCLRFDLKSMAAEYKCNRYGDFKRLANAALGALDELPSGSSKTKLPSSSPEDLKRLKVGLRESTIKARERVKIFSEVLSVINKCFPSIPLRKRSRPDSFSADRSNGLLVDRAAVGRMGVQSHGLTDAFDYEQKVEERGKNVIPNKRTRTSLMDQRADVRPNTPARSSGSVDREREVLRLPNGNALQGEDRGLPIVADGWEKAKMKKKRSGIKADVAPSTGSLLAKPIDGCREPRQGMHPRTLPDAKSRLNDSHGFRPGPANGGIGAGKADGTIQQGSMGMRSSIPRPDQENTSLLHDKRDHTTNLELERTNGRVLNKGNIREEFISGTPPTKLHAAARGPRSGSAKLTHVQRAPVSNGLESPNKNPGPIGSTNRKRNLSTRSSSPPVAQWADRRPQKISRTARRTNLVPVVSTSDEVAAQGNSDVTIGEKGRGFARRFPSNSPKQFKSKGDHHHSSTLSESEESGAAEIRSRDNGSKSEEVEQKDGMNVQKMSTLVLPTRRNKLMSEDDVSCRQPRSGSRGFASARSVVPLEKLGKVGIAKQLRTCRVGSDKPESKVGRPPTRKLSGRKAYSRQKQSAVTLVADYPVVSDDGHEELLAAANAVLNSRCALSTPFWRQMDPHFGFISDADVTYIKQEGNIPSTVSTSNPIDICETRLNGSNSEFSEHLTSETCSGGVSLCQRLLAALISEEDNDEYSWCGSDNQKYNVHGSAFELRTDIDSNAVNRRSLPNFDVGGTFSVDNHVMSMAESATATGFDHCYNGQLSDSAICSHYQYANMSIDERLLIEIHSLGLSPERVPNLVHTGDEDASSDISRLEGKLHKQVSRKKSLLNKLLRSMEDTRELQEKEFERLSLDKLTGMAYRKYMSCWGPNAPGGKSASGKMAKQAALDCVKQTLDRCHEFEATGKSCFAEPLFKEMFLSRLSHTEVDSSIDDDESGKLYTTSMDNHDETPVGVSHSSDQSTGKDEVWSSTGKKKELYLDDIVGPSGLPSSVGRAIMNSAKGKRSERDRNGGPKVGRPVKGERKTKSKLKQKTTQLSASVNGPLGKFSDQQKTRFSAVETRKEKDETMSMENEEDPLDLSHLQLPGMEDFGVGDDFGGQGEDIGSWLNIDDEVLQGEDFMGLEIPMDDLTDLNMMV